MARLDKINQFKANTTVSQVKPADNGTSVAVPPPAIGTQEANGISGFSTASHKGPDKITYANSGIVPTMTSNREYTNGALKQMNEGQFEAHKEQMNVSDKEYWRQQFEQHPESAYTLANMMFSSNETPFEKKKRERREQLGQIFSNLGNVIGNAANLYYTSKGSPYIELNAHQKVENDRIQKIRDRRQALKDKTDMLIFNAGLNDIEATRRSRMAANKAAADKAKDDADIALDAYKHKSELLYKKGKDDAEAKAKAERLAEDARANKANEKLKANRLALDREKENKAVISAMGEKGNYYTRNTPLSPIEAKQLVLMSGISDDHLTPFVKPGKQTIGVNGDVISEPETIDWESAAAYVIGNGMVADGELVARGFKKGKGNYNYNDDQEKFPKSKTAPYKKTNVKNNKKTAPYLK